MTTSGVSCFSFRVEFDAFVTPKSRKLPMTRACACKHVTVAAWSASCCSRSEAREGTEEALGMDGRREERMEEEDEE